MLLTAKPSLEPELACGLHGRKTHTLPATSIRFGSSLLLVCETCSAWCQHTGERIALGSHEQKWRYRAFMLLCTRVRMFVPNGGTACAKANLAHGRSNPPVFRNLARASSRSRTRQEETCPRLGRGASTRASEAVLDADAFAAKTSRKKSSACSPFAVSGAIIRFSPCPQFLRKIPAE